MMRTLVLFVGMLISLQINAFGWKDLWYTQDQQAQHFMQKGQFSQAKKTFERTDWLAAAAYKDGDYEKAAELFQGLKTGQGYYNQGNALAHLGQYEQAIAAYDKALTVNPNDQDALFNRNLVKELMKKDKKKLQNKDQQSKGQQNKDQQNKDQQNKDQQNKDQQNKDQQNKDQQNKDQQNQDQQNQDQQNKDQQNQDQQNKDQQNKDQQNKDQQNKEKQNKEKQNKEKQNKEKQNKDQQNQDQQTDQDKKGKQKKEADVQSEDNREKQQAKEQWLRLIPDDPGGLMREKFLRDHLRRERGWYQ